MRRWENVRRCPLTLLPSQRWACRRASGGPRSRPPASSSFLQTQNTNTFPNTNHQLTVLFSQHLVNKILHDFKHGPFPVCQSSLVQALRCKVKGKVLNTHEKISNLQFPPRWSWALAARNWAWRPTPQISPFRRLSLVTYFGRVNFRISEMKEIR